MKNIILIFIISLAGCSYPTVECKHHYEVAQTKTPEVNIICSHKTDTIVRYYQKDNSCIIRKMTENENRLKRELRECRGY